MIKENSVRMERLVLGALVNDWQELNLKDDLFTTPITIALWRALKRLKENADLDTVQAEIMRNGASNVGVVELSEIMIEAPVRVNAGHVNMLKEYGTRRREIERRMREISELNDMGVSLDKINNVKSDDYVVSDDYICGFSEYKDKIMDLYHNGFQGCVDLNIPGCDLKTRQGDVMAVLAPAKSGKTTLFATLLMGVLEPFVIFSPENSPIERYASCLFHTMKGKPFNRGIHERLSEEEVDQCISMCDEAGYKFLDIPPDERYIDTILAKAQLCIDRYGCRGVLIDPFNKIKVDDNIYNKSDWVGKCLDKMEYFAQKNNVFMWYSLHPSRMTPLQDGTYPVATFRKAADSEHHANKPSVLVALHRSNVEEERNDGYVDLHVQGVRWQELGTEGEYHLQYNRITGGYTERVEW